MRDEQITAMINSLLNRTMRRLELKTDAELADILATSQPNLSRWRRGLALGKAVRTLLPLALLSDGEPGDSAPGTTPATNDTP